MMGYLELTYFTVEEMHLMELIDHFDRESTIRELEDHIPFLEDPELCSSCEVLLHKLEKITDEDFASLDIEAVMEDTE